eukprot:TRINITY_DN1737_c0_g1_i1.p1 TRINITY_DN1737_c0_g1~~TRINITY_DN1737_c0_g1_i1.p1  ORF type:complete len:1058 (-),score=248.94 TRINITY_DN1737_c0_g1_i1:447-3620(-)
MVTQSPMKMFAGLGVRGSLQDSINGEDLSKELSMMLREERCYEITERERELNLYRSGSAPPTVDGSLAAVGSFFSQNTNIGTLDSNGRTNSNFNQLSEEELRSDPKYLSYYYSNVNLNPRLPPPILSKEDWRLAQRLAGSSPHGGIGDRRKLRSFDDGNSKSLFSQQPILPPYKEENESLGNSRVTTPNNLSRQPSAEWLERGSDGLIGLPSGGGLGARRKSFADILQEDLVRPPPAPRPPSRPASRNAFDSEISSMENLRSGATTPGLARVQSFGSQSSQAFAAAIGASLSRCQTPDPQLMARSSSPCPSGLGARYGIADNQNIGGSNSYNNVSSNVSDSTDIAAAFSGVNLSSMDDIHPQSHLQEELPEDRNHQFCVANNSSQNSSPSRKSQSDSMQTSLLNQPFKNSLVGLNKNSENLTDYNNHSAKPQMRGQDTRNVQHIVSVTSNMSSTAVEATLASGSFSHGEEQSRNHHGTNVFNTCLPGYGLSGYPLSPVVPPMMAGYVPSGGLAPTYDNSSVGMDSGTTQGGFSGGLPQGIAELQNLYRLTSQLNGGLQMPVNPFYLQYLQRAAAEYTAKMSSGLNDPSTTRGYMGDSYLEFLELQKAYLTALYAQQKSQYGMPYIGKGCNINPAYYTNSSFGLGMPFPASPIASPVLPSSPVAPPSPPFRGSERGHRYSYNARNPGMVGSWHTESGFHVDEYGSSLLEEYKSNKTRSFELSEISGHVVEFSSDQHGSRFIQQKLEGATDEEKIMVFEELFPHALELMTDVFGNYVIQKFFEHGTIKQRKDLANQLTGHIVALSLQMYGCRVIQKAIEVVDEEQKAQMVLELDGHVMRCVRDQNGNHVIQKCIECIPQEKIQFIISSFFGQVVALSTHAYGCRVIQRVLEHCTDEKTQNIMMGEILQSVCLLAEDQYGNYVVQHVLEHGKAHERAAVIKKLAGQIVKMSRQKFASNVVEKCLVYGSSAERELLIKEMLGSTDENEPLQEMMKDQFANYVVQKVLETCDDQQRELILSRIRVHLSALKKYTFGKHIVARVEKLVAAGEKHAATQSAFQS